MDSGPSNVKDVYISELNQMNANFVDEQINIQGDVEEYLRLERG